MELTRAKELLERITGGAPRSATLFAVAGTFLVVAGLAVGSLGGEPVPGPAAQSIPAAYVDEASESANVPALAAIEEENPERHEENSDLSMTTAQDDEANTGSPQLTEPQLDVLERHDWLERTSGAPAVWVSVAEQKLRIVHGRQVLWEVPCATAERGVGSQMGSLKTPPGWHEVGGKIGEDAPWGRVFRARVPTDERWQPGMHTEEDLVLTRILLLDGLEPGVNKDGDVDSRARYIYIHGTNGEDEIGTPSSHGCVRLLNDDVIEAFERIPEGMLVLITRG